MSKTTGMHSALKKGRTDKGYGEPGIILGENVMSVRVQDGLVVFKEECDGYFSYVCSPNEAMDILDDLKKWIASKATNEAKP